MLWQRLSRRFKRWFVQVVWVCKTCGHRMPGKPCWHMVMAKDGDVLISGGEPVGWDVCCKCGGCNVERVEEEL